MGNVLRKKRELHHFTDENFRKRTSVQYPSTSITPFPVLSFDEFIKIELRSIHSNSLHGRGSVSNSDQSESISDEEIEPTVFTVEYLENMYTQYNAADRSTIDIHMTIEGLNVVRHLFESLQSDMIYNIGNYKEYLKTDMTLIEKYSETETNKEEYNAEHMFTRHFIKMIITYKMILDHIEANRAKNLVQQLSINHCCLLDIKGEDYKAMNLHVLKYFLQRKLINSENIISLVGFLSLIHEEMENAVFDKRNKTRTNISNLEMGRKPKIYTDNDRCMKNWSEVVSMINMRTNIIQKQIRIHNTEEKLEEAAMKRLKKKCNRIKTKNKTK